MRVRVRHAVRGLAGTIEVPGDKSISHRAALLGALATGPTEIAGFLESEDCLNTLRALQTLGVEVTRKGPGQYRIGGVGLGGLQEPDDVLDCGNSGTTARLLLGVLAGQPFGSVLTGDESLRRRPMGRVAEPLRQMGATVVGRSEGSRLPLAIRGARPLKGLCYRSPVPSAQVKSAILLAGLYAAGPVSVEEPAPSRDHTERMLEGFGGRIAVDGSTVTLTPGGGLTGRPISVPGDLSSASFFLVAGAIVPASRVTVRGVGVNPTRTGLLDGLREMEADLGLCGKRDGEEPIADLTVSASSLRGTRVGGALIPRLIDELPILAVAGAVGEGVMEVTGARELRVKESDRIFTLACELGKLGARIEAREDGFLIRGGVPMIGTRVESHGDHRMAMALIIAGLVAQGETVVEDTDCIATSYPEFVATLNSLAPEPCAYPEGG
ncbi:MAG: 3-phosphoshikimate 1-carboxyvinyltransferase [Candidatus Rokubacteria bacterium]|nr:3-phosphoshikimate 1-carboxyvinyltransferase [Candidatus Rokubacteria bacterium]